MWIIFGWAITSIGAIGLTCSMVMEIIVREPALLLVAKLCLGTMAIGGSILGIRNLKGGKKWYR